MEMEQELEQLRTEGLAAIAAVGDIPALQQLKASLIGKKGRIGEHMLKLKDLSRHQRPHAGKLLNEIKQELSDALDARQEALHEEKIRKQILTQSIDRTLPGLRRMPGRLHPLSIVYNEIADIFVSMGFDVVEGPEVETDWYNFEALNIHADHPARDDQDSFYITQNKLLRTQTSPVQIRVMESMDAPPVHIVCPGRTFRRDAVDASHSPVFNQVEGLLVDRGITMSHLKATLEQFNREMFGQTVKTRFRPDYFPFTEPSCEVAVSCIICGGEGCSLCSRTGWLEILGAGMVHPQVLKNGGIDPAKYSGFAFGVGIDRIAMLKYSIDDIRLLYENDNRFLEQF
jgi:phenylalanyl-tRNA synthetase alpha chain